MMTPLPHELTQEELDLVAGAISNIPHPAYRELLAKIQRLRLVGKRVRFIDSEGTARVGELRGYLDWEGSVMAEIACKGFVHRVGAEAKLLGEA